jgi:hypothetical protein
VQVLAECTVMASHTGELLQDVARVYAKTARGDPSERPPVHRNPGSSAALALRSWRCS